VLCSPLDVSKSGLDTGFSAQVKLAGFKETDFSKTLAI